jgi:hypothetical protein
LTAVHRKAPKERVAQSLSEEEPVHAHVAAHAEPNGWFAAWPNHICHRRRGGLPASGATAGSVADPSVPVAASVSSPATATEADPAPARSNKAMSAAQEFTAMPMPGQYNDHSATLEPAKRASSP